MRLNLTLSPPQLTLPVYRIAASYGAGFAKFSWPWPGFNDGFFNNTCVFRSTYESTCDREESFRARIHSNRVFSQDGNLSVCTGTNRTVSFEEWQRQGHDTRTKLARWPTDAEIVAEVKKVLGMAR